MIGKKKTASPNQLGRSLSFETLEDRRMLSFTHPGLLSTLVDLERMEAKVAAAESPWIDSWNILVSNTNGWTNHTPEAVETVHAGAGGTENYMQLARDAHRAYQLALRYHGSDDTAYADKAVEIMNAWASTHTGWSGDTNVSLRAGIYGYQFACAGELLRDYIGWDPTDFANFQQYMVDQFSGTNQYFLYYKHGTVPDHYWSNWTMSNVASLMAIGVLADRQDLFDDAVDYFKGMKIPELGSGTENINNSVVFRHPNGLGQWQESGRDQGHSLLGPQLVGVICEIAWNQGIDLYGYHDNLFLASVEYISKYNTGQDVPFTTYVYVYKHPYDTAYWVQTDINSGGRGQIRPGWDLVYNHYVNRMGLAAPYTEQYAEMVGAEGGGFNYGSTSGGFDGLGFTTLTHTLDPIATGAVPSALLPYVEGRQITLSWAGSAYAESYNVKRSETSGTGYTTVATVGADNLFYVDSGLTAGQTYYYVVSANNPGGESANSVEQAVTATGQLHGTVIGTDGSWDDTGATKENVFDGSTNSYFDPPSGSAWAGLDLGSGVSAVLTEVKYAPRENFAGRMVGGQFQGSNDASNWTTLYTVSSTPPEDVLTSQSISSSTPYRYFRYINTTQWNNVAEVQFLGNVTDLSAPSTPDRPAASGEEGAVSIDWTTVDGADSYNVKRASTSGGPYTVVGNTTNTSFLDSGLDYGNYYYVVSAVNSAGESANSVEAFAIVDETRARFMFNESAGTSAADATGNGWDGTLVNDPTWYTGRIENSVRLDGTDDYVDLPDGVVNGLADFTVATWVYADSLSDWDRIFDFGSGESVYMFLTPRNGSDGKIRFAIKDGGTEQQINTSASLSTRSWRHLAVTWSGGVGIVYLNGVEIGRNESMTLNPAALGVTTQNYLGKSQYSADPYFSGRLDDFRIYNRALSPTEISELTYVPSQLGDYDQNGTVTGSDFLAWQRQLHTQVPVYTQADGDGSGVVDTADLDVWRRYLGAGSASTASAAPAVSADTVASAASTAAGVSEETALKVSAIAPSLVPEVIEENLAVDDEVAVQLSAADATAILETNARLSFPTVHQEEVPMEAAFDRLIAWEAVSHHDRFAQSARAFTPTVGAPAASGDLGILEPGEPYDEAADEAFAEWEVLLQGEFAIQVQ